MDSRALAVEQLPKIAKYDLLSELGHGGMATVYRARDRRLGREVAVKVIHRHLRESGEVARRFVAEAHAVAKLKHPNIVEIYDVSDDDAPERYLVAELVRGKSLRSLLTARPLMPPEVAACVGVELASALAHAHERDVIHRDVKPENVLFSIPWEDAENESSEPTLVCVKLTDFGIAKLLDRQGVTSTGQVLGSPAYMAPEQIDGDEVDVRVDVFSLGVLLYECMVGRLPFDGKTPGQVLKAILQGHFTPADHERPVVGTRWARVVHEAIDPDVQRRYPSMTALKAALEAELGTFGITDPRRELTAYLRDPEAYEEQHNRRLLPLLREQGQRALRKGDSMAAAAAINRAAALSPGDPEVAALVRSLMRAGNVARWRELGVKLGAAALGVAAAASALWSTTRPPPLVRALELPAIARPLPPAPSASMAAAPPVAPGDASAPAASSSVAGHRLASPAVGPKASAEPAEFRKVVLERFPPGSTWELDGNPLSEVSSESEVSLRVGGEHTLAVRLTSGHCCEEERVQRFTVKPLSQPQETIRVVLRPRPGRIKSQGPAGLFIRCSHGVDTKPVNGTYPVKMSDLRLPGVCFLLDGATPIKNQSVTVEAGDETLVSW